jgi:N-carbamoylputrescine amidase
MSFGFTMDKPKLALVQMSMSSNLSQNVDKATRLVRDAASQGAQIILLPELFENLYFPQQELEEFFDLAHPENDEHPFLGHFQKLAAELKVVLPISFFEQAHHCYFNSLCMIDADGSKLGTYRKSHIPDGPGYEEKFYFAPGDTGFKVFNTRYGKIGTAICWDQWYPECARAMCLEGAELLLYPTAIGSEPPEANALDTKDMWQRSMIGHAVSNSVPVAAANRIGTEANAHFYGASFICNVRGDKITEANSEFEGVILAQLDFAADKLFRAGMGFFRDRRPEQYSRLLGR